MEIDAIVALSLGVTADELCMIYWTQFPVMRRYDQEDRFDANGRKVPREIVKADAALREGEELSVADRTWVHPQSGVELVFEHPFRQLDREADMRETYARFEGMIGECFEGCYLRLTTYIVEDTCPVESEGDLRMAKASVPEGLLRRPVKEDFGDVIARLREFQEEHGIAEGFIYEVEDLPIDPVPEIDGHDENGGDGGCNG
mgnify:FL=1